MDIDTYIEVHRLFAPVKADEVATPDQVESWGARFFGVVGWPELLHHRRAVILAEAASGKTAELRKRAVEVREQGRTSFFAPIEHIAKVGFEKAIGRDASSFRKWRATLEPAWFFLDSVDEARVNQQDFELALLGFSDALEDGLDRAHVFISCRGSYWSGAEDLAAITRHLPARKPGPAPTIDPDEALFAPLRSKAANKDQAPVEEKVVVVRLLGLNQKQRGAYVAGKGVGDVAGFETALYKGGLSALAERPGDLDLLIDYWRATQAFGSLSDMMEFSIAQRLKDRAQRGDAKHLTDERARHGAERLAAAVTMGGRNAHSRALRDRRG